MMYLCAAYDLGTENVPYEMLSALPGGKIIIPLFVLLVFLSTVTAKPATLFFG